MPSYFARPATLSIRVGYVFHMQGENVYAEWLLQVASKTAVKFRILLKRIGAGQEQDPDIGIDASQMLKNDVPCHFRHHEIRQNQLNVFPVLLVELDAFSRT